jgi:hypothetical protein
MKVRRRFETRGLRDKPHVLAADDRALLEMRTIYPNTVRSANPSERVLKSGVNSQKLGDRIVKGAWAGSLLFSLKLEPGDLPATGAVLWQQHRASGDPMERRRPTVYAAERRTGRTKLLSPLVCDPSPRSRRFRVGRICRVLAGRAQGAPRPKIVRIYALGPYERNRVRHRERIRTRRPVSDSVLRQSHRSGDHTCDPGQR